MSTKKTGRVVEKTCEMIGQYRHAALIKQQFISEHSSFVVEAELDYIPETDHKGSI